MLDHTALAVTHTRFWLMQNDIHAPATTVYEALEFSAQMRIMDVDKRQLKDFVDQVTILSMALYVKRLGFRVDHPVLLRQLNCALWMRTSMSSRPL